MACHLLVDGVDDVVIELLVELVLDLLVLVQLVGNLLAQLGVDCVVLLLLQRISNLRSAPSVQF